MYPYPYPCIQVSIFIVSKYQYPKEGTYDDAHHVLGKTIQLGIIWLVHMEESSIDHVAMERAVQLEDELSTSTYSRILKIRMPVTSPTSADYPTKGPRNTPSRVFEFQHIQAS